MPCVFISDKEEIVRNLSGTHCNLTGTLLEHLLYSLICAIIILPEGILSEPFKEDSEMSDFCVTEDGRVFDLSPLSRGEGLRELIDGVWVAPTKPVFGADIYSARVLEEEDLRSYGLKPDSLQ